MWIRKFSQHQFRYMAPAGEGGEGGGGSGGEGGSGEGAGSGEGGEGGAGEGEKPAGDGKKTPSDEEARLLKENMKRKDENQKLKSEIEALAGLKKQLEDLGGLDSLKTLVDQRKSEEQKQLEAKGDWERLRTRMAEEHTRELTTYKDQLTSAQEKLNQMAHQMNELTIGNMFASSKFISEETTMTPTKARVIYNGHFELVDGKVVAYDKPSGASDRTPIVNSSGDPLSFEEAMKKIIEADPERDYLIRAKQKPGAGSDSRKPTGQDKKPAAEMGGLDKISAGLKGLNLKFN